MVESFASNRVELFVCARNLINKDTFSKSDPFCVMYMIPPNSLTYHEVGRTEVIRDSLNPNWKSTFTIDFFFEMKQTVLFKVLDYDDSKPDELGEAQTTLGELVSKGTDILNLSKKGKLIIRVEEVKQSNDLYQFFFKGIKLDKKDFFGKSDPYLVLYKQLLGNTWTGIYKTEYIEKTLDPIWKPFSLNSQKLCNGNFQKPIKIECYDWNRIGSPDLIGLNEVNLDQLSKRGFSFPIYENDKRRQKGVKSGTIEVSDVIHKRVLSFIDYLRAGVQISFSLAIDFTASNGEYSNPGSLHYLNPNHQILNQYEKAILEIGSILEVYDADKLFPVFGFGGVPRGESRANHCFALNFNPNNPYVQGTRGILEAYHSSLQNVSLSGPTLFHHVIDSCSAASQSVSPTQQYNILMILTDGAIMDMPETIASVVTASNLPMSIIIVGVGNADFSSMVALDCDDGRLRNNRGECASRDIIQFVPFNKFSGNPVALAAEVLKEVPSQLTEFMSMINYCPEVPRQQTLANYLVENVVNDGHPEVSGPSEHHHHHHHHHHHSSDLPPLDVPSLPPAVDVLNEDPNIIASNELGDYGYILPEGKSEEYQIDPQIEGKNEEYQIDPKIEGKSEEYQIDPKIEGNFPSAPEFKEDE